MPPRGQKKTRTATKSEARILVANHPGDNTDTTSPPDLIEMDSDRDPVIKVKTNKIPKPSSSSGSVSDSQSDTGQVYNSSRSSSSSSTDTPPISDLVMGVPKPGKGKYGHCEDEDVEESYGLDGRVIGKPERTAGFRDAGEVREGLGKKGEEQLVVRSRGRSAARGNPIAIPPPSLNLLRSLNGQLDNLSHKLPNPLPSLERWSKYLFTPKEQKKTRIGTSSASAAVGQSDIEEEDEDGDGFSMIDDLELDMDMDGRPEAENGSASKAYTRSSWVSPLSGHRPRATLAPSWLMEFHPDAQTSLRVWDCTGVGNAAFKSGGDLKGSVVWENGPHEVFSWTARRGEWVLDAAFVGSSLIRLVLQSDVTGRGESKIRLQRVDPYTDEVESERDCGLARNGRLSIASGRIVVSLAGKLPSISFLDADTFEPLCRSIDEDVGINTRSGLPVVALQGRLLAYVTSDPAQANLDRYSRMEELKHGSIVTSRSVKAAQEWKRQAALEVRPGSPALDERYSPESLPSMQAMVMHTAAGISTEVAKGVWSGLKGFGRAAVDGASRSEALSKSAPVVSEFAKRFARDSNGRPGSPDGKDRTTGPSPLALDGQLSGPRVRRHRGASWIKVLDLGRLVRSRRPTTSKLEADRFRPSLVAHFALPVVENVSIPGNILPVIDIMTFSADGTRLAIGTSEGKIVSVVEIRTLASAARRLGSSEGCSGQVWLQSELKRGVTPARISQIVWDRGGKHVGITSRNTSHIFSVETAADRPGNQHRLTSKIVALTKIRTSDWVATDGEELQSLRKRKEASILRFLPSSAGGASKARLSVALHDPTQRKLGTVSVFRLAATPPDKQEETLSMVTALWKLPLNLSSEEVRREIKETDRERKASRTSRHPFAQVEVTTFSPHDVPPSVYKDRLFTFSTWSSGKSRESRPLQFRQQVEVLDPGEPHNIQSALSHNLDVSSTSPMVPALPNGSYGSDKHNWRVQPIRVVASAVKNRRNSQQKHRGTGAQAEVDHDEGSGFMVDLSDERLGSPSSRPAIQEESWEDDLVAGIMDD